MKPSQFEYRQARDSREISHALLSDHAVKIVAGGQSLGPMLNLRLVQPSLLIDITRLSELKSVDSSRDAISLGACVTHANIEDYCVPGVTGRILSAIARGIAYRAVRNRGTLGGSLAHADPSADWISTLMALNADLYIRNDTQTRMLRLTGAMAGPFDIGLQQGEWIESVRIPVVSAGSGWGYAKIARKTGEFAHAMAAVLRDRERQSLRVVLGATESSPVVFEEPCLWAQGPDLAAIQHKALGLLEAAGIADPIDNPVRLVALERAFKKSLHPISL